MRSRLGVETKRCGGLFLAFLLTLCACGDDDNDTGTTDPPGNGSSGALVGVWEISIRGLPCRTGPVVLITEPYTRCSEEDPISLNDLLPFDYFEDCDLSSEDSPFTIECSGEEQVGGCTISGQAMVTFTTNSSNTEATGSGSFTVTTSGSGCEQVDLCYDLEVSGIRIGDPPDPCVPGLLPPSPSP